MSLEPRAGLLLHDKYRLVRRIGAGANGSVWEAVHLGLDAPVAVKILLPFGDEKLRQRFEREAKISAKLHSPHIVKVQDVGEQDESPFMVLELLSGEDLATRLKRVERLEPREVLRIAQQIAKGLAVAHHEGIVHRDLKPANVFLCRESGALAGDEGPNEIAKILDFGIARYEDKPGLPLLTTEGAAIGSPYYMSPEQALGRAVDHRSDLWSFAVLLFKLLTGARPFEGPDLGSVMVAIAKSSPTLATSLVPALGPRVDAFFARALKKDAVDRFQEVGEMIAAFAEAIESPELPASEPALGVAPRTSSAPPANPPSANAPPANTPPAGPLPAFEPDDGSPAPPLSPPRAAGPGAASASPLGARLLFPLVAVGILVLGSALYLRRLAPAPFADDETSVEPPVPPQPAMTRIPPLTLRDGQREVAIPLAEPFILNIWLERCADCMPAFEGWRRLAEAKKLPDVPIVNVSAFHPADPAWAERYWVDQNLVFDKGNALIRPLGIGSFTTLVVAPDGTILYMGSPKDPRFAAAIEAALTPPE